MLRGRMLLRQDYDRRGRSARTRRMAPPGTTLPLLRRDDVVRNLDGNRATPFLAGERFILSRWNSFLHRPIRRRFLSRRRAGVVWNHARAGRLHCRRDLLWREANGVTTPRAESSRIDPRRNRLTVT